MIPDESKRTFRNHPSVIASYMLSTAVVIVVFVLLGLRDYAYDHLMEAAAIILIIVLAAADNDKLLLTYLLDILDDMGLVSAEFALLHSIVGHIN